ncbi:MAG: hypothetical protein KJ578_15800 [Bacteroidetes bacterium]|nr:hypothetical protein [Bacteroidota bacterium]
MSPGDEGFWAEDVLEQIRTTLGGYWNTMRAILVAEWQTTDYPTLLPREATVENIMAGPEYAFQRDPQIELVWRGVRETRPYLGDQIRIAWDIGVAVFFRLGIHPRYLGLMASRYSKLCYATLRRYYNVDASGRIITLTLQSAEPFAVQAQDSDSIQEAAAALSLIVWAQHKHHRPT